MEATAGAPPVADDGARAPVRVEIGHERHELHQVLGSAARFAHDGDDVVERLQKLDAEVGADDARLGIPANLAGNVECLAGRDDAVGVAARLRKMTGRDDLSRFTHDVTSTPAHGRRSMPFQTAQFV